MARLSPLPHASRPLAWVAGGALVLWLILGAWYIYRTWDVETIIDTSNVRAPMARALLAGDWASAVDGYYPIGVPAWMALTYGLFGGMIGASKALSLAGGGLMLWALYGIARRLLAWHWLALAASAWLALSWALLEYSWADGNDVISAGLMLLALRLAMDAWPPRLRGTGGGPPIIWPLLAAGAVLGAAYLMRYTALTILPGMMLVAAAPVGPRSIASSTGPLKPAWRAGARAAGAVLISFIAVALPQLVISAWAKGNVLYNQQFVNVYLGMHNPDDPNQHVFYALGHYTTLGQVVAAEPGLFVTNFIKNLGRSFSPGAFGFTLGPLYIIGAGVALWRARQDNRYLLMVVTLISYMVALSLAWVSARHLLFAQPLHLLLCALALDWALAGLGAWQPSYRRYGRWVVGGLVLMLAMRSTQTNLVPRLTGPLQPQFAAKYAGLQWMARTVPAMEKRAYTNDPLIYNLASPILAKPALKLMPNQLDASARPIYILAEDAYNSDTICAWLPAHADLLASHGVYGIYRLKK